MEMRNLENLVIEVRETQKFVKSIAKSNKAMASMQWLNNLKEAGVIDDETYKRNLMNIGTNLLDLKL